MNGSPNMLYNNGIDGMDTWAEACRFLCKTKNETPHMTLKKFYTESKFRLLIDLRSMPDQRVGAGPKADRHHSVLPRERGGDRPLLHPLGEDHEGHLGRLCRWAHTKRVQRFDLEAERKFSYLVFALSLRG